MVLKCLEQHYFWAKVEDWILFYDEPAKMQGSWFGVQFTNEEKQFYRQTVRDFFREDLEGTVSALTTALTELGI